MCRPLLVVYFVTFLLVCSIAMMNLVTAVIVQIGTAGLICDLNRKIFDFIGIRSSQI